MLWSARALVAIAFVVAVLFVFNGTNGFHGGGMTFAPAADVRRRIDTVLVPTTFGSIESSRMLDVDLSDHEPVLVVVEV